MSCQKNLLCACTSAVPVLLHVMTMLTFLRSGFHLATLTETKSDVLRRLLISGKFLPLHLLSSATIGVVAGLLISDLAIYLLVRWLGMVRQTDPGSDGVVPFYPLFVTMGNTMPCQPF